MRRLNTKPENHVTFGPCQYCDYPLTHAFMGPAGACLPTCNLCAERLSAAWGLQRQIDFPVI